MKVLETSNAVLTNYEVLTHLQEMRARYDSEGQTTGPDKRKPSKKATLKSGNLETVMKELMDYLTTFPSPIRPVTRESSTENQSNGELKPSKSTYTPECIPTLHAQLAPFELTKAEELMILNLRPNNVSVLDTIIEEMDERLNEEQQNDILSIVSDILGTEDQSDDRGEELEDGEAGEEVMEGIENGG